jgi:hypothetical protein
MATAATIKKNIAKLEAALKSKATPKSLKSKLETQLVKSKAELSGLKKGTKPKTSSTKSTQSALKNLKELVNKNKKYKNYKGAGVDLERDADRPAKPIGRRTAKASGKTYYEYRANRIDVKQPPKRYPKLEKGGELDEKYEIELFFKGLSGDNRKIGKYVVTQKTLDNLEEEWSHVLSIDVIDESDSNPISWYELKKELYSKGKEKGFFAKGGSLSSIKEEYEENEDNNAHSENVVLLAKHFGTKEDLVEAKRILDLHEKEGYLTSENGKKRQELHLKLIEKARTAMDKEGIEFAKGGYFAKGGQTDDFYDNLQVHVQGVGTIYHGQSMKAAIKKADAYLLKNPKAEVVIVDEKYGDEYDLEGNQVENEDEYARGGVVGEYRVIPNKRGEGNLKMYVTSDYEKAFRVNGTLMEANEAAQKFVKENNETHPTATVSKIHPSGNPMKNKNVSYITKDEISKFEKGGYMAKGGYYAKGGAMEHGLKRGDTIIDDMSWDNSVKVLNNKTGYAVVHLETGERKEMKAMGGEMHRTQE